MSSTSWPCEDEAQNYMQKHKIVELLDNLTAQVVFHRPGTLITHICTIQGGHRGTCLRPLHIFALLAFALLSLYKSKYSPLSTIFDKNIFFHNIFSRVILISGTE